MKTRNNLLISIAFLLLVLAFSYWKGLHTPELMDPNVYGNESVEESEITSMESSIEESIAESLVASLEEVLEESLEVSVSVSIEEHSEEPSEEETQVNVYEETDAEPEEMIDESTDVTSSEEVSTEDSAEEVVSEQVPAATEYRFRNDKLLTQHFEKHGGEFTYSNKKEYEAGASAVINNPDALHKIEAEDGDDIYYIEATNEFVVLSTDGYIRTYFKPDSGIKYYNKQ